MTNDTYVTKLHNILIQKILIVNITLTTYKNLLIISHFFELLEKIP